MSDSLVVSWWRRVALQVAGPLCLSAPVLAAFIAVTLGISLMIDVANRLADPRWWAIALIATGLVVALLLGLRALIAPERWTGPRLVLVLVIYAGAGLLRSVTVVSVSGYVGVPVAEVPAARILGGTLLCLLVLPLASAAAHGAARHRAAVAELESTERRLIALAGTMSERVAVARADLETETREQLMPTMDSLRARLGELPDEQTARDIADMLAASVANVVRPMSHSIAEREVQELIEVEAPGSEALEARALPPLDVSRAIRPASVALLCLGASLVLASTRTFSLRTVFALLVLSAVVWLVLQAGRRWWPARWRLLRPSAGVLALVGFFTVVMLVSRELLSLLPGGQYTTQEFVVGVVFRVSLAMVVAVFAIVDDQRRRTEVALAVQNEELERLVAALKRQLWNMKRQLAHALHGPLQSTLVSSALLLSRPGFSVDDLATVRERIEQALAQIDAGAESAATIELALAQTATLWSDLSEVRWSLSGEAGERLHADSGLTAAAAEVVREGVANAVRHGEAQHVDVALSVVDGDALRIEVTDDGHKRGGAGAPGLGSRLLDEVTYRWGRTLRPSGAELWAEIR